MTEPKTIQSIEDLRNDPDNANLGTERGLRVLDDSLRECGAGRSILADRDGTIIAGNKTLLRAADIGLPVRVIQTDGTQLVVVQRTDLDLGGDDGQRERARRLAYLDNFSSEQGLRWDATQILADLEAGVNLEGLWRDDELTELLAGLVEPEAVADPGAQLSKADELQEKWRVETGDVWQCGEHRICCGDCTDAAVVEKVMGNEKMDCVFADPPYNVGRDYGESTDDNQSSSEYADWTRRWVSVTFSWLLEQADIWVTPGHRYMHQTTGILMEFGQYVWTLAWVKLNSMMRAPTGFNTWEPIVWIKNGIAKGYGNKRYDTISVPMAVRSELKGHPTPKPLDVLLQLFEIKGAGLECIYDPFLGSGTTLVACEQLGRRGRGIEIHAPYVSVALERLSGMQLDCRKVAGA